MQEEEEEEDRILRKNP